MTMANPSKPVGDRPSGDPPPDWPHVIRTKVFYGREDGHWFALDATFDVATIGATEDEALESLLGMVCSYLNSCVQDGMSFAEAQRPIPLRRRAKLRAEALLSKPLRIARANIGARESEMLLPGVIEAPL
jgi:hypothetical protein